MTLDGKQILTEVVEGNIDYAYAHGESIARVKVKAGEHSFRASYPEFAIWRIRATTSTLDGRRKLFIDYIDIGAVQPGAEPPPSRQRIFVCSEKTPACASKIVAALARRAYRRPVTAQEVDELVRSPRSCATTAIRSTRAFASRCRPF